MKQRLDKLLVTKKLVPTRSQAESFIRLSQVRVNGTILTKPGTIVSEDADVRLLAKEQYVSRAGLKLASVAKQLKLDFKNKIVLDVGSSTGGFTDFALKNGAQKVFAVDVGTDQLHPSLHGNDKIELHEQTDIRDFVTQRLDARDQRLEIDIVVIDVSFISLREILPSVSKLVSPTSIIVAMVKPQFEAGSSSKHKGVIKNDRMRREILKDFEIWTKQYFIIQDKADSEVAGGKGNLERFYLMTKLG